MLKISIVQQNRGLCGWRLKLPDLYDSSRVLSSRAGWTNWRIAWELYSSLAPAKYDLVSYDWIYSIGRRRHSRTTFACDSHYLVGGYFIGSLSFLCALFYMFSYVFFTTKEPLHMWHSPKWRGIPPRVWFLVFTTTVPSPSHDRGPHASGEEVQLESSSIVTLVCLPQDEWTFQLLVLLWWI